MAEPEDEHVEKTLATLGVGPAAKELYVDLLRPAAREMGGNLEAVAKLVTVALAPLHATVWGLDRVRDWLSTSLVKRLAAIPPEDIQPPPTYIAGQILLQLSFCADEQRLRERYADLLAAAMNRTQVSDVHVSFAHLIQQLSPDEALILESLRAEAKTFIMKEEWGNAFSPIGETIWMQFRLVCERAGVGNISLSDVYLENLLRLGIFQQATWTEGKLHAEHDNHFGGIYDAELENTNGRLVDIGDFGARFLATCVQPV